jgi:small subunit ribosomal protein S20
MMKTRVKNATKALRTAIESKDNDAVTAALKNVTSILDKAASKKVVHRRTAARKISRLSVAASKI